MPDRQTADLPSTLSDWNDESPDSLHRVPYKLEIEDNTESVMLRLSREGDPDAVGLMVIVEIDSGVPRVILTNRTDGATDVQLSVHATGVGFSVMSVADDQSPRPSEFTSSNDVSYRCVEYSFPITRSPEGEAWKQAIKVSLGMEGAIAEVVPVANTSKFKF